MNYQNNIIVLKNYKESIYLCKKHIKNETLKLIKDIAFDYDGFNDIASLKGLIDDLRAIAIRGLNGEIILERTDKDA